jgi:hypothetical protein
MGEAFSSFLANGTSAMEAARIFEIYRKYDLKTARAGQNSIEAELKASATGLVTDIASAFQAIPQASIAGFVSSHWNVYREERATLFAARSKASHVSAVLRPFHRRYYDAFISVLSNEDDALKYQEEINKLLKAECSSYLETLDWSHKVWGLFLELAVHKKDSEAERPIGMIGPGSVRTYRQQWNNWFENQSGLLLGYESNDSKVSDVPEESLNQKLTLIQSEVIAELPGAALQVTPSMFELTVSVPGGSVSVTKRWQTQSEIQPDDVVAWIDSIGELLGSSRNSLLIEVSANKVQNKLSAAFEAPSAMAAADKTIELLKAFAR